MNAAIVNDILHEVVDRARFLSDRIKHVEHALGMGYIDDAGVDYVEHVTDKFPALKALPVKGTSGVTGVVWTTIASHQWVSPYNGLGNIDWLMSTQVRQHCFVP